jgi:ABC-type branched-subunit amino acid transport system substrate-binding protein
MTHRTFARLAAGLWCAALAGASMIAAPSSRALAADEPSAGRGVDVAIALPFTGDEAVYGNAVIEGIRLAIEEANARGDGPKINLVDFDDKGTDDGGTEVARKIVASNSIIALGPAFSHISLQSGPIYAEAGVASIATTCTSDLITKNPTTFRVVFRNSDQGIMLANYVARVLNARSVSVVFTDDGYGRTLRDGFQSVADGLGVQARYHGFTSLSEAEQVGREAAAEAPRDPVLILTLDAEAARLLPALRRNGATGPILGGDALGDENLSNLLANEPEEKRQPGHFTEGVYGISPMILDSANAEILAFATRFHERFGHDPIWMSVAGYDSARLAAEVIRAVAPAAGYSGDPRAIRADVLRYLNALNNPALALPGLLGPLWFDAEHGRSQAIRIGRFSRGNIESAPLQIVPVTTPDTTEIASGAVFELSPGHFARLQRVVYTGVFINEVPRVDISQASFAADFYLWLRFARDAGPGTFDPTDINFPSFVSGGFDRARPSESGEMTDGTVYRLWRVQGTFRNDFDLHRFPFDTQRLSLSFFNARAAADRIVYVLDRRSRAPGRENLTPASAPGGPIAAMARTDSPVASASAIAAVDAFRNLTQWTALGASERRDNLVTDSSLGDPRRAGVESYRELSGFLVNVDVQRRALATLAKTLMPLFLMTLIMYASLFFPHGLVKEKVTVAITGALSGAVLLTAINSQLGGIGYTVAVEYAFYVFFGLSTLNIVSVLGAERLRASGRTPVAISTEFWTRQVFLAAVILLAAGAVGMMLTEGGG